MFVLLFRCLHVLDLVDLLFSYVVFDLFVIRLIATFIPREFKGTLTKPRLRCYVLAGRV